MRTDLGGFYFNLVMALAIMGTFFATGQKFWLLIVVMINLEILYQLMPLVRLDGYWLLADLTGVPDFFSQMGAYMRTVLPGLGLKGAKLPAMKWWAKLVFGVYLLVVLPLLALQGFAMVKGFPRVVATTWDSLQKQFDAFSKAQAVGDAPGMAASALQMLILTLSAFGAAYALISLTRWGLGVLWRWSQPTAGRRVVGALGTAGASSIVALLWVPQIPLLGAPNPIYARPSFQPIVENERGTVGDAWTGEVVIATPVVEQAPGRRQASRRASGADGGVLAAEVVVGGDLEVEHLLGE